MNKPIEKEKNPARPRHGSPARSNEIEPGATLLETPRLEPGKSMQETEIKPQVHSPLSEEKGLSPLDLFIITPRPIKEIDLAEGRDQVVLGLIAQGMTLSMIAEIPGMPSVYDVKKWSRKSTEFRDAMKIAEEARAEILADNALQVADQSTWQTSKADVLKIDTALRLAGAYDPDKFGNKSKVTSEHHESMTFIIKTGIDHSGEHMGLKPIVIEKEDPSDVLKREAEERKKQLEHKEKEQTYFESGKFEDDKISTLDKLSEDPTDA